MNIRILLGLLLGGGFGADVCFAEDPFPVSEKAQQFPREKLLSQYNLAAETLSGGVPGRASLILSELSESVREDKRLYGYTRVAVTYMKMGRHGEAKAIIHKIIMSLQTDREMLVQHIEMAQGFLAGGSAERADEVLGTMAELCKAEGRTAMLQEIYTARAAIATKQLSRAGAVVSRLEALLAMENREQVDQFEFSMDRQPLYRTFSYRAD